MEDCPPQESLERLLAEALGEQQRTIVEAHVERCPDCQNILHNLTMGQAGPASSSFTAAHGDSINERPDPQSEAFFEQLKQIKPPTGIDGSENFTGDSDGIDPFRVEGYEILGQLGRGAAGVVYRARHLKLNRLVALKVIVAGPHLSPEVRKRFQVEAQTIARLQHKNIVQIYDVGEHAECPFLSLELVEGGSLADWMAGKPKPADEAARIIATLAKAVEYAHHQGVVHRDLKPANVLLSIVRGRSEKRELKITDFGIAKVLPQGGIADGRVTQTGEILGTPAYMAPEQARGKASEICPATDVYSLGAMLYELLTGRPPFQGTTPLDTLMQAAWQDPLPISLLVPRVPKDLNTICLKCLEKECEKRYPTAAELAADLGRFLRREPIHARPLSWGGHGLRWMRRHRALAAALAGVVFLLVLLIASSLIATAHFRALEREQRALAKDKGDLADQKETERVRAVIAEQHEAELRQQAEKEGGELRQNLYFDQMNLAGQAARSLSGIGRVCDWLDPWTKTLPDLRNWEWYFLNGLCHRDLRTLSGHLNSVMDAAWSPDGKRLASASADGSIRVWDAKSGREIRTLSPGGAEIATIAWNPDGDRLVSADLGGTVNIWNAQTGDDMLTFRGHTGAVCTAAWSPDGRSIASGGDDQTVQIWEADTGKVQRVLHGNSKGVRDVAWSPDGKRVASGGEDFDIHIWNAIDGTDGRTLHGHINIINRMAWSPDGTRLASASNDQTIKIWNPSSGVEMQTLRGHTLEVRSIAWSPDGTRLASCANDQTVKIWSAADGTEISSLRGHTQGVNSVMWSPDGRQLASGSYDATIKIWDPAIAPEVRTLTGHESNIWAIAWSADGQHIASGSEDKTVRIWDAFRGGEQFTLRGHTNQVRALSWSPDGTRLASGGLDQTIRIWDATSGNPLGVIPCDAAVCSLAWSPEGHRLASAGVDHLIHVWDPASGKELLSCTGHKNAVYSVTWSRDGKRLASGSTDQAIKIWDATTGQPVLSMANYTGAVISVAWSPDGQSLASSSSDQTIKIWNAVTGQLIRTLRGHTSSVAQVQWSPDGTRLASCSDDQTVKLWDTRAGAEALSLNVQDIRVRSVAWSPDGVTLAAAGDNHTVLLYDAAPGYLFARSPRYLPVLNRHIAPDPKDVSGHRIRAEIEARQGEWSKAADDLNQYLQLNRDEHWCALGYWIAGPYPDDLHARYAPEEDQDPTQSSARSALAESPSVSAWQMVPCDGSGFVDFGNLCNHADHVSAYAKLRVYCPQPQRVAILLGSDDQARLWLNGKVIYESSISRGAVMDQDAVPATFATGWNTLLARVVNDTGSHLLYMRLSDAPGDLKRVSDAGTK